MKTKKKIYITTSKHNSTRKSNSITNINNISVPCDLQFTKYPYIYPKTSYFAETISTNPNYVRYINNAMSLCWGLNQNE